LALFVGFAELHPGLLPGLLRSRSARTRVLSYWRRLRGVLESL